MKREHESHERDAEQPAIGFVATDENILTLPRDVVHTRNNGFDVFVTYQRSIDEDELDVVSELGATVVDPVIEAGRVNPYKTFASALDGQTLVIVSHLNDSVEQVFVDADATTGALDESNKRDTDVLSRPIRRDSDGSVELTERSSARPRERTNGDQLQSASESPAIVAIPAYNEATTIASVVQSVAPYVDEVLVVDDGSGDETAIAARDAGATVIEHETNRGYGAALNTAFREADRRNANRLVTIDGDGQHDPNDVPKLLRKLDETAADIVIGSRFVAGASTNAPFYRRFGLKVINLMTNLSMGVVRRESRVADTQSGFRAYNDQAIRSINLDSGIGDQMNASIDILYHAHHNDYRLEEVGVTIDYDVENASSHHPIAHGLSLVSNILKTVELERPLTALGVPGFFGSTVGIFIAYFTISNYLTTGEFQLGMAVTSTLFVLAGLLACFTAIILHSMSRLFESSRSSSTEYPPFDR
ncbi:glycosyltransferase family 2 protein [Haloferax sp. ATB1]|uniref:glycosyltransferase family 2 protein n=1 Tax=Haloferax sp. ATB1 TaxID=1508454 RepID=UPI0009E5D7A5|nr:glycosyltransferase family 2 protein [Haloferax sp. ATB1]